MGTTFFFTTTIDFSTIDRLKKDLHVNGTEVQTICIYISRVLIVINYLLLLVIQKQVPTDCFHIQIWCSFVILEWMRIRLSLCGVFHITGCIL